MCVNTHKKETFKIPTLHPSWYIICLLQRKCKITKNHFSTWQDGLKRADPPPKSVSWLHKPLAGLPLLTDQPKENIC